MRAKWDEMFGEKGELEEVIEVVKVKKTRKKAIDKKMVRNKSENRKAASENPSRQKIVKEINKSAK